MNKYLFGYFLYFSVFKKIIILRKNIEKIPPKYLLVNLWKCFYVIHVGTKGTFVKILYVIIG